MITGIKEIFDRLRLGKTLYQIKYSLLDPALFDVVFECPTLKEGQAIAEMIRINQEQVDLFICETLNQYVVLENDRNWLFNSAPAGLVTSTFKAIMSVGRPRGRTQLLNLMNKVRNEEDLFDSFRTLLIGEFNVEPSSFNNQTMEDFIKTVVSAEKTLIRKELLEKEIEIKGGSDFEELPVRNSIVDHYRKYGIREEGISNYVSHESKLNRFENIKHEAKAELATKRRQYINFDEENRKLEAALGPDSSDIIRDDLDPYTYIPERDR